MPTPSIKLDATIRVRVEGELKKKLERIAPLKRKKFAEFMREEMWKVVAKEELGTKRR
jgi:hypothetical protein